MKRINIRNIILCSLFLTAFTACSFGCSAPEENVRRGRDVSTENDAARTGNAAGTGSDAARTGNAAGAENGIGQTDYDEGAGGDTTKKNTSGQAETVDMTENEANSDEGTRKVLSDVRTDPLGDGVMRTVFFKAGHADSFLIYTDHAAILIDAGEKGFGKDILEYMEQEGIGELDYMLITHFDKDHVGGAAKLVKNMPIGQIFTGNYFKDSDEMYNFYEAVNEYEVPCEILFEDREFTADGIHVEINTPERLVYEDDSSNNSSLIIRVTYCDKEFLFMGDAELSRIKEYVSQNPSECDVLKVPYHGIFQGCLADLMEAVSPEYAVITSSKKEKEDEETLSLLIDYGALVYKTRKGTVTFTVDGNGMYVVQPQSES